MVCRQGLDAAGDGVRGRLARAAPALAAFGLYAAATAALTGPLLGVAGRAFPHDAGDPVLNTWLLWWSTREAMRVRSGATAAMNVAPLARKQWKLKGLRVRFRRAVFTIWPSLLR